MKTTTITALVAHKQSPPRQAVVSKVVKFCERIKFGDLIEKSALAEKVGISPKCLREGKISTQLQDFRYLTRETRESDGKSIPVSYYGSRKTIIALRRQLARLEGEPV